MGEKANTANQTQPLRDALFTVIMNLFRVHSCLARILKVMAQPDGWKPQTPQ